MAIFGTVVPSETFNFRNRIINGDMRIWQRGTSATISDNSNEGYNTVDRWKMTFGTSAGGAVTWNQSTDTPDGQGFAYSLKVQCSTTGAATGTQEVRLEHIIEGFNVNDFAYGSASPKTVILSFWFKTNKVGIYSVYLQTSGSGTRRRYFTFTPAASDTWERISITISGDSVAIPNDNGAGFLISIYLDNTPDYDSSATSTAWGTSILLNNENNVNFLDSTNNILYLTGVQLEVGSVATPFERRPYGMELSLCQRYYWKFKNTGNNAGSCAFGLAFTVSNQVCRPFIRFPVEMRTYPTSVETTGTASDYRVFYSGDNVINCSTVPSYDISTTETVLLGAQVGSGVFPAGGITYFRSNSVDAFLGFSAEL